ncbi:hypothetical protein PVAP13_3KG184727 [Panicum virgatum]|uniref:Uncharacterized protein n=1 Tax=Panicum virgatum TaxID=38727 RepID=A0A8T0UV69_PANVG|nr:hypothetical protein PVAP13_3KG184727 [Panicum virgatum]
MCKLLIEDFQANVDATDVEGATPLVFAVQGTGSTAVVSLLLSHGADANKADNGGISPLHIAAAERGFYEVAELLMSKGADVDPICENGGAPVHIAAKNGHAKVLKLLLRNKADSERLSTSFNTPLVASLFGSSVECLEVLIEAGVDVNAGSPATPLTLAADKGLTEFINCLLEAGADANIPDEGGIYFRPHERIWKSWAPSKCRFFMWRTRTYNICSLGVWSPGSFGTPSFIALASLSCLRRLTTLLSTHGGKGWQQQLLEMCKEG